MSVFESCVLCVIVAKIISFLLYISRIFGRQQEGG